MSEIKVNKLSPRSGTDVTLGDSGDTFTIPSGATLVNSGTAIGFASTAWQSVQTTGFTAVAGNGYPCNTTSAAFTVTLPASANAGDTIVLVDYAGTFASNNITLGANGLNIEGATDNKFLITDREGVTCTYVDATQGWVATSGVNTGTQAIDPVFSATGGTITTVYPYTIHTFTTSGTFTPSKSGNVDYLVVGGGGSTSGAAQGGGGGGAGGLRSTVTATGGGGSLETALSVTAQAYTVTVGGGGAIGSSGSDSALIPTIGSTITADGGGRGGAAENNSGNAGVAGGSGGGGSTGNSGSTSAGGSATQGYAGGTGNPTTDESARHSGGGGGAGVVGVNATTSKAGNGGNGLSVSISGSATYYAGGGGGGGKQARGDGGLGGGGNGGGGNLSSGNAGNVNTGGGAGAGFTDTADGTSYIGRAGGSGIVIIRYLT